jgi:hypothetical protein
MITISVVKVNDKEFLTGVIGKDNYKIEFSEESKAALMAAKQKYNACETGKQADKVVAKIAAIVEKARKEGSAEIEEVLEGDLYFHKLTNTYHIKVGKKIGKTPVNKFFVDKMIEANDKGISPKPWLVFWVRLMRNALFRKSDAKVANIVTFLQAKFVDNAKVEKLMQDEGYAKDVAKALCTYDQVSITEEGLLATFKYVSLATDKYVIVKNEETGEQEVVRKDRFERDLECDEMTGKITKDELKLPAYSEEIPFIPPVMGNNGDAFTCHDIADAGSEELPTGHTVKVGKIHELTKGFTQVNCDDGRSGVMGLHTGGYYYVQGFGGKTDYLLDCLVAPEDIGAVCDVSRGQYGDQEGAIRSRRYMAVGAHFAVSSGMYHPSKYAAMLDGEWNTAKEEAIQKVLDVKAKIEEQL